VALEAHDISLGMRWTSRRAWFGVTMLSLWGFVASGFVVAGSYIWTVVQHLAR